MKKRALCPISGVHLTIKPNFPHAVASKKSYRWAKRHAAPQTKGKKTRRCCTLMGLSLPRHSSPRSPPQSWAMRRPTRTRRRASAVFRFLPSPLHPKGTKHWRTKLYRWRQGRIYLHRWSVKTTRKFTRISPIFNALRVKVKGEGKKCELRWVRDAQARVRLGAPTHARSNRRRSEKKKARGFPPKEAKKDTKQESIRKKVHLFLSIITTARRKHENCFVKASSIRNKRFIFALE